jgi:hypothetical protein
MSTTTAAIPEPARRRDDFDARGCEWVALADGQRWALPLPWVELRAHFRGGKAVAAIPAVSYGADVDALLEAIAGCHDPAVLLSGAATLAAELLRRNYELSDAELDALLAFRGGAPDATAWARDVLEVATGQRGRRLLEVR